MRRVIASGSMFGALAFVGACATTAGTTTSSVLRESAQPRPQVISMTGAAKDAAYAQAIAGQVGPRVSIRAQVTSVADARRVRALFHVDDDAYVVVGHIDADGVLRIAFPTDPTDDGFVHGNRSYQTNEFFAGFNAQYRFRARNTGFWNTVASQDSYDGGFGYVFIIASWRPMRSDRFQTGNVWDTFEITDDAYMRDPRPAINELATLLAGDNNEAYTVKFARYTNTEVIASSYGAFGNGYGYGYSSGYCLGYEPYGFASSAFANFGSRGYSSFGYNFAYRGTNYYYDAGGDCYRTASPWSFGLGYRVVQGLPNVPTTSRPRPLDVTGKRPAPEPQPLPGHLLPLPKETAPGDGQLVHTSPEYRQRGLITNDDGSTGPVRREPRIEAPSPVEHRERPTIQEMVKPRTEPATEPVNGGWSRATQRDNPPQRETPQRETPQRETPQRETPQRETPQRETPQRETPQRETPRSEPAPRMAAPERPSPPVVRSEPAPRMQVPERAAPQPERASPPPRAAEPRSEPASRPTPPERPSNPPASSSTPPVKPPI